MFENLMSSILEQSWTDYEVIYVNDASTDNSAQILRQYVEQDNRIRIHCVAQNSGQGLSRNAGTQLAQGQYVFYVDQDDALAREALAYLQKIIIKQNSPDIISFSYQIFEIEQTKKFYRDQKNLPRVDERLAASGRYFTGTAVLEYHLKTTRIAPWVRIIKREIAQKVFFPGYLPEDYLHSLQVHAVAQSLWTSKAEYYVHFRHAESCGRKNANAKLKSFQEHLAAYIDIQNSLSSISHLAVRRRLVLNYQLWFIWAIFWWLTQDREITQANYQKWAKLVSKTSFSLLDHVCFFWWRFRKGRLWHQIYLLWQILKFKWIVTHKQTR